MIYYQETQEGVKLIYKLVDDIGKIIRIALNLTGYVHIIIPVSFNINKRQPIQMYTALEI